MGMNCTVCEHPQLTAIEVMCSLGSHSERTIADQFGLKRSAIRRHTENHLAKRVSKAVDRAENKQADDFLDSIRSTISAGRRAQEAAMEVLDMGGVDPDLAYRMAPAYMAQSNKAAELLGQATGRLNQAQGPAQTGNVYISVVLPRQLATAEPAAIDVKVLPEPED